MTRWTWRRSILPGALMIAAFAVAPSADHAWSNYHWARSSNPVRLDVGDNLSSQWKGHLTAAIADWNQSDVLVLTQVAGVTNPKNCRPTAGRIEACNARYGNTGWLGIAQIWISGAHITQAITKVNDTYFNAAPYNDPDWRQLVMCQEIAHDFGLDHQDEDFDNPNLGSCMDYTSDPDGPLDNTRPNAHDFEQLESIYAHTDGGSGGGGGGGGRGNGRGNSGAGAAAAPGQTEPGQLELESPSDWGQLVRTIARGRVHVYERDFGGGRKVLTHVFWADPDGDSRGRR
jgi:hypothetical protein